MISNLVLQNTVDGLKEITKANLLVFDAAGNELVSTGLGKAGLEEEVLSFLNLAKESQSVDGKLFYKIYDEDRVNYVLVVMGDDENTKMVGKLAAFQLQGLLVAYKERFDKENFIKNLIMDNLLLVDIFAKAKKLHIDVEARRVVYIVETEKENDSVAMDKIKALFPDKTKDFITLINERSIVIVKLLGDKEDYSDLEKIAHTIELAFDSNHKAVHIAYGTIVGDLREMSRSYKEARIALDVGKIFFEEKMSVAYSTLGIGRLIYQLPIPLCRMFIREIFQDKSPDDFDEETLITIYKFFENNLNVSETSRQLFIHRNTLVYRLDKLKKMTGLDLHSFEDAIIFKIALMVVKYMKYMESQDF